LTTSEVVNYFFNYFTCVIVSDKNKTPYW